MLRERPGPTGSPDFTRVISRSYPGYAVPRELTGMSL